MKFQVSVLSDKGVKKVVLTTVADSYTEQTGSSRDMFLLSSQTKIRFYMTDLVGWRSRKEHRLVASVLIHNDYVIEEVSDAAYS